MLCGFTLYISYMCIYACVSFTLKDRFLTLPSVRLLQARVKEVSVVSAGSDGPTQRLGAWEPGPSGIPPLFVSGCVGDLREARDKWEAARQWRHEFQIDKVRRG